MSLAQVRKVGAALEAAFPHLFDRDAPVPLKLKIHEDVAAEFPEMPTWCLRTFLRWWTIRRAYLVVCTEGAHRFGLDSASGHVTAAEAAYAAAKFTERQRAAVDPWPQEMIPPHLADGARAA